MGMGYNGLNTKHVFSLIADGSRIFASTNSGVFISPDLGDHWYQINGGLSWFVSGEAPPVNCLALHGNTLYAGLWFEGLYKASIADLLAGIYAVPELTKKISALYQNKPNPFSSSTEIRYKVISGGAVSLNVYDLFGKEVMTLVNEMQPPGKYSVTFHPDPGADNPGSAVYFYRLTDKSSTQTRKMILIR